MKKWNLLDQAVTGEGKSLSLHEHDGKYVIRLNGADLMSTAKHASEEELAKRACAHLGNKRGARVLVGGLGFGFTLRATLLSLPSDASVVMAEIMPAIISWNQSPKFKLAGDVLSDPRVKLVQADVMNVISQDTERFDAIILDIDNGPTALSVETNSRLYEPSGLRQVRKALRPGGCVGFWSASADPAFERTMKDSGFDVEVHRSRAHSTKGTWHTLFMGRAKK